MDCRIQELNFLHKGGWFDRHSVPSDSLLDYNFLPSIYTKFSPYCKESGI